MKHILLYTFIIFFTISTNIKAQGIEFFHGTWDEVIAEAKKENKLIFVDAYTTWCGPCKRMQREVFPQKKAGDFYNKYFINVKMNMETQEGMKFGLIHPVGAYPTLLFISSDDKLVYSKVGGKRLDGFIEVGKTALKSFDKSPDLEIEWEKGNRDYSFVLKYIKALNLAEKFTNKVALDYLRSKPDITNDQKAVLLFEATSECDSKLFEMMTNKKHYKRLKDIYSKKEISDKIYSSCWKTIEKSFEFDVEELQNEAKKKMKKYNKKKYKEFVLKIELLKTENNYKIDDYLKAAIKYFKVLEDSDSRLLFIDQVGEKFHGEKKIPKLIEELSEKALKKEKTPATYTKYIKVLINNKKYTLAIQHLGKAIKLATDENKPEYVTSLKRYKRYLQKVNK